MNEYKVKLTGWEGSILATSIEEARYIVRKTARILHARVLWVGKEA